MDPNQLLRDSRREYGQIRALLEFLAEPVPEDGEKARRRLVALRYSAQNMLQRWYPDGD